jgi:hypothetical protein
MTAIEVCRTAALGGHLNAVISAPLNGTHSIAAGIDTALNASVRLAQIGDELDQWQ